MGGFRKYFNFIWLTVVIFPYTFLDLEVSNVSRYSWAAWFSMPWGFHSLIKLSELILTVWQIQLHFPRFICVIICFSFVVFWFIRCEATVQIPSQISPTKWNMNNDFSSADFCQKPKLKNSVVRSRL